MPGHYQHKHCHYCSNNHYSIPSVTYVYLFILDVEWLSVGFLYNKFSSTIGDPDPCNNITSMTTGVDAVSLKLPTFWTSTPTTWFAQAEAQFIVRNITNDDTKYYYVIAALDSSTANRAKNKTCSPPPGLEPGSSDCRSGALPLSYRSETSFNRYVEIGIKS